VGLVERERELVAVEAALERSGGDGGIVLFEGPPGIGKTALMARLREGAEARGRRVLRARGSEIEREFGFGVVRQLFGPLLRSLDRSARRRLFVGPAALAAAIFGFTGEGLDLDLDVGAVEAPLYGLFWLLVGLTENGPLVLAIDDAHWADSASLRFIRYLGERLHELPVLVALAARPREPGAEAEALRSLAGEQEVVTVRPGALSAAATAGLVRERLGAVAPPIEAACHEASGGNPLLLSELLVELESSAAGAAATPEGIAAMGSERIAAGVAERVERLGPGATEVVRAAAVLGDASDLRAVAALAAVERPRAAEIVDGLAAATVLVDDPGHAFVHPLLRAAVYEAIPAARRSEAHGRAATLLREHGAEPEAISAHLLACAPGGVPGAFEALDAAAHRATARGAPESTVAYLQRALPEAGDRARRGDVLHRLGTAGVTLRDPGSLEHLGQAAELAEEPRRALEISMELIDVLSIAGQWEAAVATIEAAFDRFGTSGEPALLELEAYRAASRAYDPARSAEYSADLPRLLALVEDGDGDGAWLLRQLLAGFGAVQEMPRQQVLELVGWDGEEPINLARTGRENTLAAHGILGLLIVDELGPGEAIAAGLVEDGRRRGSLLAMIGSSGYRAALEQRRGRLTMSEAELATTLELLRDNELGLMAATTFLHFCIDTVVERSGLDEFAGMVLELEVPPPFDRTASGGYVLEVRGALRMARGEREAALADFRAAATILRPIGCGPRISAWRSRLALALPESERVQALRLAAEELELARGIASPRAEGVALRTLAALRGGVPGIELLRQSLTALGECPSALERARTLAELGAALRRGNRRAEARELLREASDLAQRCGAERLEERIAEELRIAGAKPRRRAVSGPDSLTPAERRVAAAAAAGASNREISQALFVSLRTVEMHLTNAYRKLGISSRGELEAAIEAEAA
jgi:DNA-binding CsgD family transcriptional regulator